MKTTAAVLALTVLVNPLFAQERAIDLPKRAPDSAVALSRSLIVPGAGWFYLHRTAPRDGDVAKGVMYFLATAGGVALMISGARTNKKDSVGFGAGLIFGSRILDLWGVTDAAAERK